jgi:pimeloyl-ACP methyl ester carboxylesterase
VLSPAEVGGNAGDRAPRDGQGHQRVRCADLVGVGALLPQVRGELRLPACGDRGIEAAGVDAIHRITSAVVRSLVVMPAPSPADLSLVGSTRVVLLIQGPFHATPAQPPNPRRTKTKVASDLKPAIATSATAAAPRRRTNAASASNPCRSYSVLLPSLVASNPVLIVGGRFDPATRYLGAMTLARLLPRSRLLTLGRMGARVAAEVLVHQRPCESLPAHHAGATPGTVCQPDVVPFAQPALQAQTSSGPAEWAVGVPPVLRRAVGG